MIFYLLLCNVLFIPLINSSNSTTSKPELTNKIKSDPPTVNQSNETKVTLLSEGGLLLPGASFALPKEKLTNLDSELSKNKAKPVVARKGVVYIEDDITPHLKNSSTNDGTPTITPIAQIKTDIKNNLTISANKTIAIKVNSSLSSEVTSSVKNDKKTDVHKKPAILSYDAVANATVKSSPETLITAQIQSPNKVYTKNANSHPGMVMPLVITILLVPMFAVLGYMALRRGQEAWKNRHYKRMDFLLDGMYND
uniref:24 kDa salivary protein n=1 Tax=Heliothis virescens TaxID=7102 RepID=A0A2A4J649_HELVI